VGEDDDDFMSAGRICLGMLEMAVVDRVVVIRYGG
jgi:hypothetical protein